jgi:hypothetical protein
VITTSLRSQGTARANPNASARRAAIIDELEKHATKTIGPTVGYASRKIHPEIVWICLLQGTEEIRQTKHGSEFRKNRSNSFGGALDLPVLEIV